METEAPEAAMLSILGLNGPELILVVAVILLLFGAKGIPAFLRALEELIAEFHHASRRPRIRRIDRPFRRSGHAVGKSLGAGLGKPVADALTHSNQTWEIQDPPALRLRQIRKQMKDRFILWIAQGFGVGRIPFAPGTFGS